MVDGAVAVRVVTLVVTTIVMILVVITIVMILVVITIVMRVVVTITAMTRHILVIVLTVLLESTWCSSVCVRARVFENILFLIHLVGE